MCNIYKLEKTLPKFNVWVIAYIDGVDKNTKKPVFAKLERITIEEKGTTYHWKERDSNGSLDVCYWSDYPAFDENNICDDGESKKSKK